MKATPISRIRLGLVAGCAFPAPRGSQVLIDEMAIALSRSGAEPHLIAPVERSRFDRSYVVHASPIARPASRPTSGWLPLVVRALFDAQLLARLAAVTRRHGLSVLHAHNYEGLVAALAVRRLRRIPVVYHSHNVLADELPAYAGRAAYRAAHRFGSRCDRWLPRLADQVVTLSSDVAQYLRSSGVAPDRLSVIPPGLDPSPFDSPLFAAAPHRVLRTRRAVFAGNLDRYQNLELLLDAWALASAHDPGIDLTLVTHAPTLAVERMLEQRGLAGRVRIVTAGSLVDVTRELATAALGVSPRSSWSGFPIKTLNYMASRLPTVAIAASAKGIRDGETGWVVGEACPAALATTLLESLSTPEDSRQRGAAAREALAQHHSWDRLAPRVLDVSQQAMG